MGLFTKGPHKFRVTAKGGDRTRTVVQWPVMKPFAILFVLTLIGLVLPLIFNFGFNHISKAGDGIQVILFWTLYNLLVLAITMMACIERPRANRPQRMGSEKALVSIGRHRFDSWVLDLGADQARVRGPNGLELGDHGVIALNDVGDVVARVSGELIDGYRLDLQPTHEQRIRLLRKLHTVDAAPGAQRGDLTLMVKGWMRSLTSR
jgi:cellulose synthase (UDP-forming)